MRAKRSAWWTAAAMPMLLLLSAAAARGQGSAGGAAAVALQEQIAAIAAEPAVARSHWGVAVEAMDGAPLAVLHEAQLFHPASNAKLLTTSAAVALLGPAATLETRVVARGAMEAGTLEGDLVLVGVGDATLATEDVPYQSPADRKRRMENAGPQPAPAESGEAVPPHPLRQMEELADQVVKAGVTVVTGDVVGDDTRFAWEPYPEAWSVDDLMWGYGAPVSALSVHDNQMEVRVRPGARAGVAGTVELEPGLPASYTVDASGLTTTAPRTGTHVGMDRAAGSRVLRVWGTIAVGAKDEVDEISIEDPAEFAARALRAMLLERGVVVRGGARAEHRLPLATAGFREQAETLPGGAAMAEKAANESAGAGCLPARRCAGQVLAAFRSPTLADDELFTNKVSQNLHAELLLERLGERMGAPTAGSGPAEETVDPGSRAQGVRVVRSFLIAAAIDAGDVVLYDGSGLSLHDLVTPRALVSLLVYASRQPWFAGWRATLPVAGEDGTLAGRFARSPIEGRLFAKTGTLGEARALSGYLECASGKTVALSILVDNHAPGGAADREAMDRMVAAIYAAE